MTVRIDCSACNGCGQAQEPACVRVCPGGLLLKGAAGKAMVHTPQDCWDCAACVKECPQSAISLYLPVEAGGRGSSLQARKKSAGVQWTLTASNGNITNIYTAGKKVI